MLSGDKQPSADRYKLPSAPHLNKHFAALKENKEIGDEARFLIVDKLNSLKNAKTPNALRLFVAGLVWFLESNNPPISKEILSKFLDIREDNPLNKQTKVILLSELALYAHKSELALQPRKPDAKTKTKEPKIPEIKFSDEVSSTALRVLETIPFTKIPNQLIEEFQAIPGRYKAMQKSFLKRPGNWISDYSAERTKQRNILETTGNLIAKLTKAEEPLDYEAIIIAASLYIMHELEKECTFGYPRSDLYKLLQNLTKISHSSKVPPDEQKLYFDEFFKFIKKTKIEEWENCVPKDAPKFNIKQAVFNEIYDKIPVIKLSKDKPRSIFRVAGDTVGNAVRYAASYAKEFAILRFIDDLYMVRGLGKNTLILRIANQISDFLSLYVHKYGHPIIQRTALGIGEAVERKAVTFSLAGMFRVTLGYLTSQKLDPATEALFYKPSSDPFGALIGLALIHAKKENVEHDIKFFESVTTLYKILPKEIKKSLNDTVQEKISMQSESKLGESKEVAASITKELDTTTEKKVSLPDPIPTPSAPRAVLRCR